MLTENPFSCDCCGKNRKDDVNHWWVLIPFVIDFGKKWGITVWPWNDAEARVQDRKHVCGVNCAMKLTERFLTSGSF